MIRWLVTPMTAGFLVLFGAAACGGSNDFDDPDPPVGAAVLPDIVPTPPEYLQMFRKEGGKRWEIAFSSTLVNIGDGPFVLRAKRDGDGAWHVEQIVEHATSGAEVVAVPAELVWGGDGHDHWHISRVATNRLVRLGADGKPVDEEGLVDSKVGFCFYDHTQRRAQGVDDPVYVHESCGKEDDVRIGMGLSPGWEDIYPFILPGQTIDVSDVPDGRYRLWVTADENGWFHDRSHENNVTWADLELTTKGENRFAEVLDTGPTPRKDKVVN
jgi:lysyl oxidase